MKIALDISPLASESSVRGIGFYTKNLKKALEDYYPNHTYLFLDESNSLPLDIDIVHYPYFDPFFLTLPQNKAYPTVVTVHDLTPLGLPQLFPSGIKGKMRWFRQKRALHKTNAIITDSHASKKDIITYSGIPEEKIHVVYLAAGEEFGVINDQAKISDLKKKYNLPENFVLYVGDATANKNLPRLLDAIQKLRIPLVMAGKALAATNVDATNIWNKDLITVQERAKEDNSITVLGFIPSNDLVLLYNAATLTVVPSLYEGFGLPVLEAMQSGSPVVTTHEGSLSEVAGDAAVMVDAYNVDAIAKGLHAMFEDNTMQNTYREKGLKRAKEFSWKKTATETIQVYTKVFENTHETTH